MMKKLIIVIAALEGGQKMKKLATWIAAVTFVFGFASAALADPTSPVVVDPAPEDQGDIFLPGVRPVSDLSKDYVEEEYFVSGAADLFNYAHNPPLGPTDITPIQEDVPYKTRIIVRRPHEEGALQRHRRNRVVELDAGFDTAPVWDPSADVLRAQRLHLRRRDEQHHVARVPVGGCSLLGLLPPRAAPATRRCRCPRTGSPSRW